MQFLPDRANEGMWAAVETRVPLDPPYDDWVARAVFLVTDERPVLVDLHLRPVDDDLWSDEDDQELWLDPSRRASVEPRVQEGITTRLLRAVSLPELERSVRSELNRLVAGPKFASHRHTREVADAFKRPGRRGRGDDYYARWAADYVALLNSDRPVADLAEAKGLKQTQVRDLIREARRRGLLTKTTRGRGGGSLTAKGRAVLRGAQRR